MAGTAATRLALAAALLGLACHEVGAPRPSIPRIDFVDGALEPFLRPGQSVVLEGFGFGPVPGTVTFPRVGGGQVAALAPDSQWSERTVRTTVPDSAAGGTVTILTASGTTLTAPIRVLPAAPFDPTTIQWTHRNDFPLAPVGVALAAATVPNSSGGVTVTLFAAGGAEPIGGDSAFLADSGVYSSAARPGGAIGAWTRQKDTTEATLSRVLPVPRAFAAAAVGNRYNSHFDGSALYVIGGVDSRGRAQAGVYGAATSGTTVVGRFETLVPLPTPLAGAIAVVRRGRVYVFGGADSSGRPQRGVFVGRIGSDGQIDGWYAEPALTGPRAYGGGVVLDDRAAVFGGFQDSAPVGGGLNATPSALATADTAAVSLVSGFLTGSWAPAAPPLPAGRSQFATLDLGTVVLLVGGRYAGDTAGTTQETLAAAAVGDSLAPFAAVSGVTAISALNGGILVGPAGVAWRDGDGTAHGIVLGGFDLVSRSRKAGVWGF